MNTTMSDQEIRIRLADALAKSGIGANEARAVVDALYPFVTQAKA